MNNEEIIIDVDATHRIKITKHWSGQSDRWMWKVLKQRYFKFWFKNGWYSSSWDNDGGMFFDVTSYDSREQAVVEAEYIKKKFLRG